MDKSNELTTPARRTTTELCAGDVYHSEPYSMFIEYAPDERGDPTVELWRFTSCEDDGEDGAGYLELRVHEILETKYSGTLAVYYRQWFAPDGEPAWGNRPRRVIGSVASLRNLIRRRKMTLHQPKDDTHG